MPPYRPDILIFSKVPPDWNLQLGCWGHLEVVKLGCEPVGAVGFLVVARAFRQAKEDPGNPTALNELVQTWARGLLCLDDLETGLGRTFGGLETWNGVAVGAGAPLSLTTGCLDCCWLRADVRLHLLAAQPLARVGG